MVVMSDHTSIFRSLLALGVDMVFPPTYVSSRNAQGQTLAYGFLGKEGRSCMQLGVANLSLEGEKVISNPVAIFLVHPVSGTAETLHCEWPDRTEGPSPALDRAMSEWLAKEISNGHYFERSEEESNSVQKRKLREAWLTRGTKIYGSGALTQKATISSE
jgi:hypothetical protein